MRQQRTLPVAVTGGGRGCVCGAADGWRRPALTGPMSTSEEQEGAEPPVSPGSDCGPPASSDSDSTGEPGGRSADSAAESPAGRADSARKRSSFMIADVLRPASPESESAGERAEIGSESAGERAEIGSESAGERDDASKDGAESSRDEPAPRPADTSLSILASIQRIVENHAKMLESRAPAPLDRRKTSTAVRPAPPDGPRPPAGAGAAAGAAEQPARRRSVSPPPPPPAHQQPLINSRLNFSRKRSPFLDLTRKSTTQHNEKTPPKVSFAVVPAMLPMFEDARESRGRGLRVLQDS